MQRGEGEERVREMQGGEREERGGKQEREDRIRECCRGRRERRE
jgi:hypothetical protein